MIIGALPEVIVDEKVPGQGSVPRSVPQMFLAPATAGLTP